MQINTIANQNINILSTLDSTMADGGISSKYLNGQNQGFVASLGMKKADGVTGFFSYGKNSNLIKENDESGSELQDVPMTMEEMVNTAVETLNNLVTDEDYSQFAELGITADEDDMKTIVTVYERIQIHLAAYGGGDISGLNISPEKIDKVLKSKNLANGVKMQESIGNINDNAKEYILKNGLEPTVENVYKAVHSGEKGSRDELVNTIEDSQWQQLKPQVKTLLNKDGMEQSEENLNAAKWLMDRNIPLNTENIVKYEKLKDIENPESRDSESIKANMILAEVFGMNAADGYMTSGWMSGEKIEEVADTVENATLETAAYIVTNNLTLNVANLQKYSGVTEKADSGLQENLSKVLSDAKALLTAEGALLMTKMGIDVRYEDIRNMTDAIKKENDRFNQVFFDEPTEEKTSLYQDVMNVMASVPAMPVAAIGSVIKENQDFNIINVHTAGTILRERFEKAGETYEAVGTRVRRDLGDSIGKAFKNADNLIKETGLDVNDDTRRAVRILGYNNMEITKQSVLEIAEKASELDKLIKNMTPKTVVALIERGINPLDENIEVLNDKIVELNEAIGAQIGEEYSKYLWKLEKSGSITQEQRAAYIEMYRILKTVSKSDARSIGAVMEEGGELTLGNLFSAERSRAGSGMDINIDNETGYYQGRLVKNKLDELLKNITANNIVTGENVSEIPVNQLYDTFLDEENARLSRELDIAYEMEKLASIDTGDVSEEMLFAVLDGGMEMNLENIAAAKLLIKGNDMRKKLFYSPDTEKHILDSFDDEESVKTVYKDLENTAKSMMEGAAEKLSENEEDFINIRNLANVTRFMAKAAENRSYNVPMEIGGSQIVVKVKFSSVSEDDIPAIDISADVENLGKISIKIKVKKEVIEGNILCENQKTASFIEENMEILTDRLDLDSRIQVAVGARVRENSDNNIEKTNKHYTNRELYSVSKTFLESLKLWGEMSIN